jgi:hypothetical protein
MIIIDFHCHVLTIAVEPLVITPQDGGRLATESR